MSHSNNSYLERAKHNLEYTLNHPKDTAIKTAVAAIVVGATYPIAAKAAGNILNHKKNSYQHEQELIDAQAIARLPMPAESEKQFVVKELPHPAYKDELRFRIIAGFQNESRQLDAEGRDYPIGI